MSRKLDAGLDLFGSGEEEGVEFTIHFCHRSAFQ